MLAKINSMVLHGAEAVPVLVEVIVSNGMGYFMMGQPDEAVRESLGRAEVAIKSHGFHMPRTKISINLSPAPIRKTGSGFDLPIALGILLASEQLVDKGQLRDLVLVGELGLDGSIHQVRGVLCMAIEAVHAGIKGMILSRGNAREAALAPGLKIFGVSDLMEVVQVFRRGEYPDMIESGGDVSVAAEPADLPDFQDVRGQETVKRALEIAAAGGHNTLLIGPPGVGKTMLASRLPSILPPMTREEILETSRIYSLLEDREMNQLVSRRPFRNPHHTASDVALTGGGSLPMPGEISLAHNGVLFLDELYEFNRTAIEVLRQPLEEGRIRICRARMSMEYPARFMLVAAMNPCFCGYHGHPTRKCSCSKKALEYYRKKSSSPLLERIDLHVKAEPVQIGELVGNREPSESSAEIRRRVVRAREIQVARLADIPGATCNAVIPQNKLEGFCPMEDRTRQFLLAKIDKLQLSARSYSRILKVSRTIADLAGKEMIELAHIAEAVSFRVWEEVGVDSPKRRSRL
jgi:magnesium chelatase family protein